MVRSVVQDLVEAGLDETQFKRAELAWQEADDLCSFWRWNEDTVDSVNDAIGTKLHKLVSPPKAAWIVPTISIATMRL